MHTLPWHVPVPHSEAALDQLDVLESLVPHHLQVVDGHLRARAHGTRRRARRQLDTGRPPDRRRARVGRPPSAPADRGAQIDATSRRAASHVVDVPLDVKPMTRPRARSASPSIRLNSSRSTVRDDTEVDACSTKLFGSLRGEDAAQHVALAHRMELGRAGGQHDVVGVHVQHLAVRQPHDHDRARIDADDIVAQFAGENGDRRDPRSAPLRPPLSRVPAPITTRSACCRRNEVAE